MLQAALKVVGGKHDGEKILLAERKFLIGREQDCHLRPNSDEVSRHHCAFTVDDYTVRLRDLGSTNGTIVNGERIQGQVVLKEGDCVQVGNLKFEVEIGTAPSQQPEAPVTEPSSEPADASQSAWAIDTQVSGSDTVLDIPAQPGAPGQAGSQPEGDTSIFSQQPPAQPPAPDQYQPQPGGQQPAYYQQPPGAYPQHPAGPYPQQPQGPYPQPAGVPPQGYAYQPPPPQYPYQHPAPPYPPQGAPPPQQPGGYPQHQGAPQQGDTGNSSIPPVRLPPPESTGAQQPQAASEQTQQKASQSEDSSKEKKDSGAVNPSNQAADIISKYLQRRPTRDESE